MKKNALEYLKILLYNIKKQKFDTMSDIPPKDRYLNALISQSPANKMSEVRINIRCHAYKDLILNTLRYVIYDGEYTNAINFFLQSVRTHTGRCLSAIKLSEDSEIEDILKEHDKNMSHFLIGIGSFCVDCACRPAYFCADVCTNVCANVCTNSDNDSDDDSDDDSDGDNDSDNDSDDVEPNDYEILDTLNTILSLWHADKINILKHNLDCLVYADIFWNTLEVYVEHGYIEAVKYFTALVKMNTEKCVLSIKKMLDGDLNFSPDKDFIFAIVEFRCHECDCTPKKVAINDDEDF